MKRPFLLYHWSPSRKRQKIAKQGLRVGCRSRGNDGSAWYPKHVCFCRTPSAAWALSAMHDGRKIAWDLWCCWSADIAPYTTRFAGQDPNTGWTMTEYRSTRSIAKSRLWYVGMRMYRGRKACR